MMVEQESDDMAIVALDSHDEKTDTRRARAFGNFLYGSEVGRSLSHIVETPFFVSSMSTVGIQIADLLAYALAQQNLGRTDLRAIGDRFRELEWRSKWDDASPRRGFRFEDLNIGNYIAKYTKPIDGKPVCVLYVLTILHKRVDYERARQSVSQGR